MADRRMALGCGARCLRLTIFAFNFIFFVSYTLGLDGAFFEVAQFYSSWEFCA